MWTRAKPLSRLSRKGSTIPGGRVSAGEAMPPASGAGSHLAKLPTGWQDTAAQHHAPSHSGAGDQMATPHSCSGAGDQTATLHFTEGKTWCWQRRREDAAFPRPSALAGLCSLHRPGRDVGSTAPPYSPNDVLGQWRGPSRVSASPATGPPAAPLPSASTPARGALPAHGSADAAGSRPAGVTKGAFPLFLLLI